MQLRDLLRSTGLPLRHLLRQRHPRPAGLGLPGQPDRATGLAGRVLLYQLSIGSGVADIFRERAERKFVNYHNITPADLLEAWMPAVGEEVRWGRAQLRDLAPVTEFAIADSGFNERSSRMAGYRSTTTVPLLIDLEGFAGSPDPALAGRLAAQRQAEGPTCCSSERSRPTRASTTWSRPWPPTAGCTTRRPGCTWSGGAISEEYQTALERFTDELGLADAVEIAGSVTHEELIAYYAAADAFVCLSNHEGFCVPLLESMYHRLPIVAYTNTAVPETVQSAGLVLPNKEPARVAAAIDRVVTRPRPPLRTGPGGLRAGGRVRPAPGAGRFRSALEAACAA